MGLTRGDILQNITIDSDGCWIWNGVKTSEGYGIVGRDEDRKTIYAHRLAHELWNGPIPPRAQVHHNCEKKSCCRPKCVHATSRSVNQKQYHVRRHGQMSRRDLRVARFFFDRVGESAGIRMVQ
jgi:hypothetical protein